MENINVSIPASEIEEIIKIHIQNNKTNYSESIASSLAETFDFADIAESVMNNIDHSVVAEHIVEELDYSTVVTNMLEYIDYDEMARSVRDYLDIPDELDVDSEARNLLESYDPKRSCETGRSFTKALASGFLYILKSNDEVRNEIRDIVKNNVVDVQQLDINSNLNVNDASNNPAVDITTKIDSGNKTVEINHDEFLTIIMNAAKLVTTESDYRSIDVLDLSSKISQDLSVIYNDKFNFGKEL